MPRLEEIRSEVQRLLWLVPFRPFVLVMENGDRVVIEHPENIAFEPTAPDGTGGSEDFYVISRRAHIFRTFGAVTSVSVADRGEPGNGSA
jgi:hypothetical protein